MRAPGSVPAALAATIFLAVAADTGGTSAPAGPIRARFIGNMALQLTDGWVTLRTDFPYESGYSRYMTWTDTLVPKPWGETLCLVTHSHRDHFLASLAARYCTRLAGPKDVTAAMPQLELEAVAGSVAFGPMRVTPLATPHARLEHYSYLVEWHAFRFYFTGDTEEYHHEADETVPEIQGRELPRQGDELVFSKERP